MGMTLAEKILSRRTDRAQLQPGELLQVPVDVILANDITGPPAIAEFRRIGLEKLPFPQRVVLIPDHFTPNRDIAAAEQCRQMREFAREQKLQHYYEVGRCGIEHVFVAEQGLVAPGDVVVGADSHTCTFGALGAFATGVGSTDLAAAMATGETWFKVPATIRLVFSGSPEPWVSGKDYILRAIGQLGVDGARYRALEFAGPAIDTLSMDQRFTMTNMAVEAGAKVGLMVPDQVALAFHDHHSQKPALPLSPDPDAVYEETLGIDVSGMEPQVAEPYSPANVKPVSQVDAVRLDQVVIGSCTNGRLYDLEVAARILEGRQVHPDVRLIILPGSPRVLQQALERNLLATFYQAGAVVAPPTCGPCLGGHTGVLAAGEIALATTNRNFVGRMGHRDSRLYLSGPAVAAASAVAGVLIHPQEVAGYAA